MWIMHNEICKIQSTYYNHFSVIFFNFSISALIFSYLLVSVFAKFVMVFLRKLNIFCMFLIEHLISQTSFI